MPGFIFRPLINNFLLQINIFCNGFENKNAKNAQIFCKKI